MFGLSILVLLLNTGCSCNKRNLGAKKKNITSKAAKEKKLLLSVRKASANGGPSYYFLIAIKPSCAGTAIENYFITAKVLEGQGQLLGAKEKVKNKLQYEVHLEDRCLASLLLRKRDNADTFRSGKQVGFRCRYDPREGTKKGDMHQLAITVIQKDEEGKTIQKEQAKLTLSVKQDIKEKPKS